MGRSHNCKTVICYIYTSVCLTNMGISLGSVYLYSFIDLVNDFPSQRFLINSILYCSLCRIHILAHTLDAQFHYNVRFNSHLEIL